MSQLNIIKFNKMGAIIKDWVKNPNPNIGVMGFMGAPGIGKTSIIRQACVEAGKELSYINAGIITMNDLMGCATPDADFRHTRFLPPQGLLDANNPLFIDELTNFSDRSVACALSNLLLEGIIPGHPTRYNEARMYACNPTGVSELAETIPRILVNRGALYMIDYEYADFVNYALNVGVKRVHPVVASFIQETKENYLHVKEFTCSKRAGVETPGPDEPFPTPRAYELLSDRLWRMERGLPTSVFEEAYATIGSTAGKVFGDHWAMSAYMPKVSDILAGKNPQFPEKAFKASTVMSPIQGMVVFGILGAAEDVEQFRNGCEWLFAQLKKETVGRELLRTFADAAKDSVHRAYQHECLNALGSKAMGAKDWTQFLLGSLKSAKEASNF
jgi:hypothetical protein